MGVVIGRKEEIKQIRSRISSNKSEFIAIYGRRRVGKTYLVKETFGAELDFSYTGIYQITNKMQLASFKNKLSQYSIKGIESTTNWFEAFQNLKNYLLSLKKNTIVVFIDELPWLDSPNNYFVQALANFWNTWSDSCNQVLLKLLVCGSSTSWMMNKLIGDKGGLYNRLTLQLYLKPFSLKETKDYFIEYRNIEYSDFDILNIYMILGGIPYYLDLIDPSLPISVNIDKLCFKKGAPLNTEFQFLYKSLFLDSEKYKQVIVCLSSKLKGLTRQELLEQTHLTGGELTKILENLSLCDFIRKYTMPNKRKKDAIYQLIDLYSLFYLRFISNNDFADESYWTKLYNTPQYNTWAGNAFEQVCLHHLEELKKALGITGILTNAFAFQEKDTEKDSQSAQIDLVFERADRIYELFEMKYSFAPYEITSSYNLNLANKMEVFKNAIKTKKTLKYALVSPFGLQNTSHMIQSVITLEDLFQ